MTREDLEILEEAVSKQYAKVRQLGGYDTHAANEIVLFNALYEVIRHLREKSPRSKETTAG